MAKFYPMFSSSKGNCTYVGGAQGGVLIDAGVSCKRILAGLQNGGVDLSEIKAVLITHEHSDHIQGLRVLLKKTQVPVIASRDTVYALEFLKVIGDDTPRVYADELESFSVGPLTVRRFATSHDCKGSSGYIIDLGDGVKTAVCTDLGVLTDEVKKNLDGCTLVMLESNHDPVMLRTGPYPPELKLRVGGEKGHLSNAVCAAEIAALYESGTTRFVLAHLSEQNNTPEKAAAAARAALIDKGARENEDYLLYIAPPEGGKVIAL